MPRFTLMALTIATILALAWMARALNHLGRTVHVDTSIAQLGRNAARSLSRNRHQRPAELDFGQGISVRAAETGYVDEIRCDEILKEACARGAFVRLVRGNGGTVAMLAGWLARALKNEVPYATFRLHIKDQNELVPDLEGVELPNLDEAIEEAVAGLRSIAAECLTASRRFTLKSIVISDDEDTVLAEVTTVDALAPLLAADLR
ncbi:MAG: DUF6894 family protein [Allorhizobium sp.]